MPHLQADELEALVLSSPDRHCLRASSSQGYCIASRGQGHQTSTICINLHLYKLLSMTPLGHFCGCSQCFPLSPCELLRKVKRPMRPFVSEKIGGWEGKQRHFVVILKYHVVTSSHHVASLESICLTFFCS